MKPFDIRDRTFQFAIEVINLCRKLRMDDQEYVLSNQLLRSGTAVGALVREASNGESAADFIHKMAVAQKECDETIYWLALMAETKLISKEEERGLKQEAEELLKIIRTIILNKKKNQKKS